MESEPAQDPSLLRNQDQPHIRDRDLLNELLETIPFGIYFKDLKSRFIRVNRNLAEAFSVKDPAVLIGKSDADFLAKKHAHAAREDELRIIRSGKGLDAKEEKFIDRFGEERWVLTTKEPLRDHSGAIIGTLGISRDITDLKRTQAHLSEANAQLEKSYAELKAMQAQLIAAEKAAVSGRLAAGLAHEIKNPLAMIRMGVDFLGQDPKVDADEGLKAVMATIRDGVERADQMLSHLQTFVADELAMARENVNEIAQGAADAIRDAAREKNIQLRTNFLPDLPGVSVDKAKITQVLIHLLKNAIQASPEGGEVKIATNTRKLGSDEVSLDVGNRSGVRMREDQAVVIIEVLDSGPGIPGEVIPKIFEPFFTTRPTGEGAGLGLTLSAKLVELHGGELRIENLPERGAKATLLLAIR
jgi:hypothetical protein